MAAKMKCDKWFNKVIFSVRTMSLKTKTLVTWTRITLKMIGTNPELKIQVCWQMNQLSLAVLRGIVIQVYLGGKERKHWFLPYHETKNFFWSDETF